MIHWDFLIRSQIWVNSKVAQLCVQKSWVWNKQTAEASTGEGENAWYLYCSDKKSNFLWPLGYQSFLHRLAKPTTLLSWPLSLIQLFHLKSITGPFGKVASPEEPFSSHWLSVPSITWAWKPNLGCSWTEGRPNHSRGHFLDNSALKRTTQLRLN